MLAALAVGASFPLRAAADPVPVTGPNWAGYAVTAPAGTTTAFTAVRGRWTEPAVRCGTDAAGTSSVIWVGLGGFLPGSPALEQIGTTARCDAHGVPRHEAWFEFWPYPSYPINVRVRVGDAIGASVEVTGWSVRLQLRDITRRWSTTKTISSLVPDLSSAEWIVEAPQACVRTECSSTRLAEFDPLVMTELSAATTDTTAGLVGSQWTVSAISLLPGQPPSSGTSADPASLVAVEPATREATRVASPRATPGEPSPDGRSFTVIWSAGA
jgi:Peptidase A4 family